MVEQARAEMVVGAVGVGRNSDAKEEGEANKKGDEDSLDAESQAKAMRIAGYCAGLCACPACRQSRARAP